MCAAFNFQLGSGYNVTNAPSATAASQITRTAVVLLKPARTS
jgi:hypothetical protein